MDSICPEPPPFCTQLSHLSRCIDCEKYFVLRRVQGLCTTCNGGDLRPCVGGALYSHHHENTKTWHNCNPVERIKSALLGRFVHKKHLQGIFEVLSAYDTAAKCGKLGIFF